jgi:hypothetical protein
VAYVQICSGRSRIIPLMRRPHTDIASNMPVQLPRNRLLTRYVVTSPVHTVTIQCYGTPLSYKCVPSLIPPKQLALIHFLYSFEFRSIWAYWLTLRTESYFITGGNYPQLSLSQQKTHKQYTQIIFSVRKTLKRNALQHEKSRACFSELLRSGT